MSFFRETKITATRKAHRCDACSREIQLGDAANYFAQIFEGDFYAGYYHRDCREAEIALNKFHDYWGDEWMGLNSIEDLEDIDWLRANYPNIADRMGLTETA